jgi:hypothetical protein
MANHELAIDEAFTLIRTVSVVLRMCEPGSALPNPYQGLSTHPGKLPNKLIPELTVVAVYHM